MDPTLDSACLLVGRFLFSFGAIERELNIGVQRLFSLNLDTTDTICANIDFYKKVHIVRSALSDQDPTKKNKAQIKQLFGKLSEINDHRLIVAHAAFSAAPSGGVAFSRTTAKTGLRRDAVVWTEEQCQSLCTKMTAISDELRLMVRTIAPYHPSLDFSDARNSTYIALLF